MSPEEGVSSRKALPALLRLLEGAFPLQGLCFFFKHKTTIVFFFQAQGREARPEKGVSSKGKRKRVPLSLHCYLLPKLVLRTSLEGLLFPLQKKHK